MKVLVTGANGLLGQHLVQLLSREKMDVIATGRGPCRIPQQSGSFTYVPLDLVHSLAVHEVILKHRPDVIVHAAAMTQVDACETDQESCFESNVQATSHLLLDAEETGALFIYISTDFVFDGEKGNYNEEDEENPLSWYGFTKIQAEAIVQTSSVPWAIIRTCLVYGNPVAGTRNNIMTWVRDNLKEGKTIRVVNDQWRTPTHVEDLSKGILLAIKRKATGIFHISGKDSLTPWHIALQTARYLNLDENLISPVNATTFSQPGRPPLKPGFDISKARKERGFEPMACDEGLRKTLGSDK